MKEKIELVKGDITEMKLDAIVNAANTNLVLGGGLAGIIRTKGGSSIQEECTKHGPVPLGGAAITGAGKLPAKHIIHAASMALGGRTTARTLVDTTLNCLRVAKQNAVKTIAFPAIGTGIGGFPIEQCARIMLQEVSTFLQKNPEMEKVYFVLYNDDAYDIFKRVYDQMFEDVV